MYFLPCIGRYE